MEEEIKALRSELALLKLQFSERVHEVESRIDLLIAERQEQISDALSVTDKLNTQSLEPKVTFAHKERTTADTLSSKEHLSAPMDNEATTSVKSSRISLFFISLMSYIFEWFSPVSKIYQSYKERGMLGTFVLTIAGISLTLAGFGYLMQLLIDQLGAGSKAMLMCLAALLVMAVGIGLKVKTRYDEFATAIVTLGILLSYNTVYFSGSVYGILPVFMVIVSYFVIAVTCHVLALWLDTKIVAALGIIGISTMPVLSNTIQIEPHYYLFSLALIAASSLVLAFKRVGQWLANVTLAFSVVSIEWILSFENVAVSTWIVEAFYLLFFAYIVATLFQSNKPTKQALIYLATTIGACILLMYQTAEHSTFQLSVSFTFNTIVSAAIATIFYRFNREIAIVIILSSAIWGVLAIVSIVSSSYWGMAWAAEGLLLIFIGRKYLLASVTNQGQLLAAGAIFYSLVGLSIYFPLPALKSLDGWLLSLFIVVAIAAWQRAINDSSGFSVFTRAKVKPGLQLVEVVWLSVLTIASLELVLGDWTGPVVILGQIALLYRAKYCKQTSIEVFTATLILVPLFYAYQGAESVGSYRFTALPLFAKLSIVSAGLQLWLWSEFYRRFQPNSQLIKLAEAARILFYLLIPICWVSSSIRRLEIDALMVLWLSPILALMLAMKIKHHLLEKEAKLLTVLASLTLVMMIGQLSIVSALISLAGFIGFFSAAYWFNQKTANDLCKFICSCGFVSLGIAIPHLVGSATGDLFFGLLIASLYWSLSLNFNEISEHLRRNETLISVVSLLLVIASWGLLILGIEYAVIPLIFIGAALYQKDQRFMLTFWGRKYQENTDLFLHSIYAITYVLSLYSLSTWRFDLLIAPALAVHGAIILFLKDKRLTTIKYSFGLIGIGVLKLALIDAANALLWQKVFLFMGIGVFILFASFWYQKLLRQSDTTAIKEPKNTLYENKLNEV